MKLKQARLEQMRQTEVKTRTSEGAQLRRWVTQVCPIPKLRLWLSGPAAALLIASAACAPGGQPAAGPTTSTDADVIAARQGGAPDSLVAASSAADGLDVYASQYCGVCHELGRAESVGTSGPTHNAIGTIAAQRISDSRYTGQATTAEAYLRESIIAPVAYIVPGYEHTRYRMPAYINLSESELEALVQLLLREE